MSEIWKDIKGYEGLYQISNQGRVKSLQEWNGNRHSASYRNRERILKPTDNGHGYLIVGLKKETKRKNHYIHRLVAEAFVENPKKNKYVNHLDYDKANNKADNLEWCSQKENVLYSKHRMEHQKNAKLPKSGYKYIKKSKVKEGCMYEVSIKTHLGYFYYRSSALLLAILRRDKYLREVNY